jgi:hypothetical protein
VSSRKLRHSRPVAEPLGGWLSALEPGAAERSVAAGCLMILGNAEHSEPSGCVHAHADERVFVCLEVEGNRGALSDSGAVP